MKHRSKTVPTRLLQVFAFIWLASPGWAQQGETELLDEIVVTATRMESSLRDVARSVSVVQKDRIQNATQQLGLDEALSVVPGVYIQNRYNFAGDLRVAIRGFGARSSFGIRGIRVFVDGIPETLPDGQSGVDSIDLGSAQSIEVLRGPASSLYGNSSGGVIAVTSELGDTEPYVEGKVAGGEFGYQHYGLKTAGQVNAVDYLFNLSRSELDGYRDHSEFLVVPSSMPGWASLSVMPTGSWSRRISLTSPKHRILAASMRTRQPWIPHRQETGIFSSTPARPLNSSALVSYTSGSGNQAH